MIRLDESWRFPSYCRVMGDEGAHVRLRLETKQPIALTNFVSAFVGFGSQFEKFVAREHPDMKTDSEFYVKEVRSGSIEADLVAWVSYAVPAAALISSNYPVFIDAIDQAQVFEKFVVDLRARLSAYFQRDGRNDEATRSDLTDFAKAVAAIANDPNGAAELEAAAFEDGKRKVRAVFKFKTAEAREAETNIGDHRRELEATTGADHRRVLMTFVRSSVQTTAVGKRSGELVVINALHPKPLPVVYASSLAEQRIKHEIKDGDDNVYKRAFDVDVNVETRSDGTPIAYRIVELHSVIDTADDDEAA